MLTAVCHCILIFCPSTVGVNIVVEQLVVGNEGTLICSSERPNTTNIEWLDGDAQVVVSMMDVAELNLTFILVNDSLHNSIYTCRVSTSSGMSFNDSVELSIQGMNSV